MVKADPRRSAFDILLRVEKERSYADILIDRTISGQGISGPDRGLLTELVYGVLRRRGTLDHVINQFCKIRSDRMERNVLILIRLGLYQILYLDRIPVSAAVNETVNMAKAIAPRASGLINAVLRRADRERQEIRFPDRNADPVAFIAARHSQPQWMVEQWIGQLGLDEAEKLASVMAEPPPLTVRVNRLRTSREAFINRLADSGIEGSPTSYSHAGVEISSRVPLSKLPEFRDGLFTIQDESSQLAATLLEPAAGERVLDLCAAPGGKATHLAELMGNSGSVLACDAAQRKLPLIDESAARLGITIISTVAFDATMKADANPVLVGKKFDRVLVDAPCSGLGVLRRNPDGKWWKSELDVAKLAARQRSILANAASLVEEGGLLLYSTCSTSREENEEVVADFLSKEPGFVLENMRELFPGWKEILTGEGFFRSWPHRHGMDGFFAARMRKKSQLVIESGGLK